jgi:hypothetical protein
MALVCQARAALIQIALNVAGKSAAAKTLKRHTAFFGILYETYKNRV